MGREPLSKRAVFYAPEGVDSEACAPLAGLPEPSVVDASGGRPSLRSVIDGLRAGDVLIVQWLSDIADEPGEVVNVIETLAQRGVRLRVLREGLDSLSPEMPHVLRGLRMAAALLKGAARASWRRDIETAREQGAFRAGRPRRLRLADVAELRAQGLGAAEIARRLGVSRWSVYRRLKELGAEG